MGLVRLFTLSPGQVLDTAVQLKPGFHRKAALILSVLGRTV